MPEKELLQAMPGPEFVGLGGLPCPYEVPQHLVKRVRHPHCRQLSTPMAPGRLLRIAPIRFHSVPDLHGDQRRGDHATLHSETRQKPIDDEPRRPGLVADPRALGPPSFFISPRIDSARFGIVPIDRTSPSASATATAIVSECTSRPTQRVSLLIDQSSLRV